MPTELTVLTPVTAEGIMKTVRWEASLCTGIGHYFLLLPVDPPEHPP